MTTQYSRRTLLRGASATVATVGTASLLGAPSSVYAAPALIQSQGSALELVYWTTNGSGTEAEAEETLTAAFEEANPGVTVKRVLQTSYEDTAAALIAALQTGDEPNIAVLSDIWWFRFYLSESLADLNPLLTAARVDTDDYVQSLYIEYQRNGGQYAVPYGRSTPLLYFNRDALTAAGLDETIFKTWSSFAEHAPALVGGETEVAFGYGSGTGYGAWLLQSAVWAFGGHYSDPDFTIRIAEPEAVAAGEYFRKSVQDGWGVTSQNHEIDFINKSTAAILSGSSAIAQFVEAATFEVGTAFVPEEKQFGCSTGGNGLTILKSPPQEIQAAAMDYMAFLTSAESTLYSSHVTGYMPVRTSAIESPEEQAYLEKFPNNRVSIEQLPLTQPQDSARVFIPNGDAIIGAGWERILNSNVPAQEAFDRVKAELDEEKVVVLEQIAALEG